MLVVGIGSLERPPQMSLFSIPFLAKLKSLILMCVFILSSPQPQVPISFQLYAKGGEDGPEHRRAHRLIGAWEFAKLARHAAERGRYVIGVRPHSLQ